MIEIPSIFQNTEFRFILLAEKSKLPIEEQWQSTKNYMYYDERLKTHLNNNGNYGILAGPGNLRILDIDDKNLAEKYKNILNTLRVKTCGGTYHFYFITEYDSNMNFGKGELRCKNQYVVGPNCYAIDKNKNHEGKYEIEKAENGIELIRKLDLEDFKELIKDLNKNSPAVSTEENDALFEDINEQIEVDKLFIDNNIISKLGNFTIKLITQKLSEDELKNLNFKSRSERDGKVITTLLLNGFGNYIKSIFKLYPVGDKYLEHTSPDKYLMKSISNCRIYSGVINDKDITLENELESINERVLRNKINLYLEKIAKVKEELMQSYLLGVIAVRTKLSKKDLIKKLTSISKQREEKKPIKILDLISKELPEVKYYMNPLLPKGQLILFGGKPGTFKSMLALSMILSIKNKNSFLNKFEVSNESPKILLYDLENGEATLWWRLKYLIKGLNIDSKNLENFNIEYSFNKENLDKELEFAKNYDIIILDSYRRFLKGTENDSEITDKFFREYLNVLKELGKTIIIIHHFKKGNLREIEDSELMDIFRGSSDIPAQFDLIYSVNKEDEIEKEEEKKINFDISIVNIKNRHGLPIKNFCFNVFKNDAEKSTNFKFIGFRRIISSKERIMSKIVEFVEIKRIVERKEIYELVMGLTGSQKSDLADRYLKELIKENKIIQPIYGKYAARDYENDKKDKKLEI